MIAPLLFTVSAKVAEPFARMLEVTVPFSLPLNTLSVADVLLESKRSDVDT